MTSQPRLNHLASCQNFDISLEIFKLPVTISDVVRCTFMLDIWVVPSGWGLASMNLVRAS